MSLFETIFGKEIRRRLAIAPKGAKNGGPCRTRICDLSHVKGTRYQLRQRTIAENIREKEGSN